MLDVYAALEGQLHSVYDIDYVSLFKQRRHALTASQFAAAFDMVYSVIRDCSSRLLTEELLAFHSRGAASLTA